MPVTEAPHLKKNLQIATRVPINCGKLKRCWRLRTDQGHGSARHDGKGNKATGFTFPGENGNFSDHREQEFLLPPEQGRDNEKRQCWKSLPSKSVSWKLQRFPPPSTDFFTKETTALWGPTACPGERAQVGSIWSKPGLHLSNSCVSSALSSRVDQVPTGGPLCFVLIEHCRKNKPQQTKDLSLCSCSQAVRSCAWTPKNQSRQDGLECWDAQERPKTNRLGEPGPVFGSHHTLRAYWFTWFLLSSFHPRSSPPFSSQWWPDTPLSLGFGCHTQVLLGQSLIAREDW